ncbi:MAG: type II secretion system protein [Pirellulales bacterium]
MAPTTSIRRNGFTLAESLVAMTILAISGSALLLGVSSSLQHAEHAREQTIATGVAEQMIDEVLGKLYMAPGGSPLQWPMSANGWELAGDGRSRFDDTDDYHGYTAEGLENIYGVPLGSGQNGAGLRHENFRVREGYFDDWKQEFELYYVDEDNPQTRLPNGAVSYMRCVEVRISRKIEENVYRNLVTMKRVFAYIPPPN